jgi:hypothetical protein
MKSCAILITDLAEAKREVIPASTLLSMVFSNVPTFDESHGVRRIAAVRM